jgi:hypothetical protein
MRLGALFGGVNTPDDENMASSSSSSASTPASVPDIPMVDDSKFLHGRVDPGLDENIALVESVPGKERETAGSLHGSMDTSSSEERPADNTPQLVAESPKGALKILFCKTPQAAWYIDRSVPRNMSFEVS